MRTLNEEIDDLEVSLNDIEKKINNVGQMPESNSEKNMYEVNYLYVIYSLVPLIVAAVLYLMKPSMLMKKVKGKEQVSKMELLKWTSIISVIIIIVLVMLNYFNVIDKLKEYM